jgi:hypothetical protein
MMNNKIVIPKDKIEDFCRRWKVVEFALFGSALRDDERRWCREGKLPKPGWWE